MTSQLVADEEVTGSELSSRGRLGARQSKDMLMRVLSWKGETQATWANQCSAPIVHLPDGDAPLLGGHKDRSLLSGGKKCVGWSVFLWRGAPSLGNGGGVVA